MVISEAALTNGSHFGLSRRKKPPPAFSESTAKASSSVQPWGSNGSSDRDQCLNDTGRSTKSHRSSIDSSFASDGDTLSTQGSQKSAAGVSSMYQLFTDDFEYMIQSESVRRVMKLLFSSLAVVFQETQVSPSKSEPYFTYTRIPSIPAPAARMLWSELLGGVSSQLIGDREYEMNTLSSNSADPAISQICLETFVKCVNDPDDLLVRLRKESSKKGFLKFWGKKGDQEDGNILRIPKRRHNTDPFLCFVRDALMATGFLEVAGGSIEQDKEEADTEVSEAVEKIDDLAQVDGIDTNGWKKRENMKKVRKPVQCFQIYKDMQFQYGIHLSGMILEKGFAVTGSPLETSTGTAHLRELDTMKRWNDAMSNACLKQLAKENLLEEKKHGKKSANENDDIQNGSKFDDWMNQDKPPDEAMCYAIQMHPSHLMRAGRVVEAARVLMNPKFVLARLVILGALETADRHRSNLEEMKLRSRLASEGELDVGGDGDALIMESRDIFMASVNVLLKCIQEHYPIVNSGTKSDKEDSGKEEKKNDKEDKQFVQGEHSPGEVGRALHLIATFLAETHDFPTNKNRTESSSAAMETYKLSLDFKIAALGRDQSSVGNTYRHMGHEYMNRCEYKKAIDAYTEAIRINRVQDEVDYKRIILALNSIGMIYGMIGQPKLSVDHYSESLAIQKTRFGEMDLQVAETLNSIGIVYGMMGDYDHAVQSYAEALFIKTRKLGKDHEDVADIHFNRGLVHNKDGDYESAFHDFQQALRIRKIRLGDEHEEVARVLHHIGVVLGEMGEPVDAQRCYEECLRIRRAVLGDEHEDVARTLHNLGLVYFDAANYEKALDCLEDAKELGRKKIGRKSEKVADTLHTMGLVYQKLANFKEAINNYDEAVKIRRLKLGEDHLEVASTLHNMGDVYYMMGDLDLAMSTYDEAYQIRRSKLGTEDHVDIASTRNNMGVVFMKQGQHDEAMKCFAAALATRQEQLGPDHEKCSDTLHNMGLVHKNLAEYEKAIERYEQALRVRRIQLGENDMKVADTLYNMAIVYANTAQYAKAIDRYKEALRTYRETGMTDDHPSVVNTLQWIRWGQKKLAKANRRER
mmetsp:Transcript_18862/g.27898  ORF Transcript_18862/g.27898 Transcript_18862/m.27898 type:complete len:1090 (-) Transcript_18862:150-3419(-)|eukprot:CAMPEP_0194211858 /NCGR_PEP_ID=MMETSP0156-20130528/11277_1 /TAXON_ID=33649 /ORGANISM="Thalassionema nitzschioides, Strain L26-B" /LENGTH=1089 /DNA_ID=CAMNT_0038939541 /DNA_START=223 /DNA_END=3492 /DNA_ORIENTATION=+